MGKDLRLRIKELYERNPRSRDLVKLISNLYEDIGGKLTIMNFCGTHEWVVTHYGLRSLVPEGIELIAGPGCPVCVTPGYYVEVLARLSFEGYHILTYGDAYRLPSSSSKKEFRSLAHAKAFGGKVTIVYSFLDAIKLARSRRDENFIFFAIGFETTMPSTAEALFNNIVPKNLMILSTYRLTPPIMDYLLSSGEVPIDGVIAPGHVSAIIGWRIWEFIPRKYGVPTVVSGFEPIDVLISIAIILNQIVKKKPSVINEYKRVVSEFGNLHAKKIIHEVYDIIDAYWRGIGIVPNSGAIIKDKYRVFSANRELGIREPISSADEMPGCLCSSVVLGKARPTDCPHFLRTCTPDNPYGPCMVSYEGTCRIWAENMDIKL